MATKLTGKLKELSSRYIAEEVATGKYPHDQAVAIGISRARAEVKKQRAEKRASNDPAPSSGDQVGAVKQAIREALKADQLAERAAVRVFEVFRSLKFDHPGTNPHAVDRLDKAHDQLGEAKSSLREAAHQLKKILQENGYTLPSNESCRL